MIALARPRLTLAHVQPGDILLFSGQSWLDRLVRTWTRSTWDHVGIAWPPDTVPGTSPPDIAEALPGGVRIAPLAGRTPFWCVRTASLELELGRANAVLVRAIGRPYSYWNALLAGLDIRRHFSRQYECAQLVSAMLSAAGFPEASSVVATPEAIADLLARAGCSFDYVVH